MPVRLAALNETGEKQKDIAYIEYNGALAEKGAEAAVLNAIIAALATGADAPAFDAIRLGGLRESLAQAVDPAGLNMRIYSETNGNAILVFIPKMLKNRNIIDIDF